MYNSWWQCSVWDLMILSILIFIHIDILILHILWIDAIRKDDILLLDSISKVGSKVVLGISGLNVSM